MVYCIIETIIMVYCIIETIWYRDNNYGILYNRDNMVIVHTHWYLYNVLTTESNIFASC